LGGAPLLRSLADGLGARFVDAAPSVEVGAPVLADRQAGLLTQLGHDRVRQRLVAGLRAAGVLAPPR
ncbi:MAG: hypothetical protein O2865_16855, partial [Planctomycetota bacterium]|nr:hypothetical protein [Planctomycetota bacterium]